MDEGPQTHSIQVNGAELTYVAHGEGDAVVFVHGALGDYRDWIELLAPFAEHYRTIAYSRRRHWPNAWPDDDSGCDAGGQAADLTAVIDALELAPAHLVGHSYGALTALLLAAEQPDRVRALVLGEPPLMSWLDSMPDGRPLVAEFPATAREPARQACQQGDLEAGVHVFIDGVIGEGAFKQIPPAERAKLMDNAPEMRMHVETPTATNWPPFSCEDAKRVRVPALLLSGEFNPPLFQLITRELARCLPTVEQATIPGVSHDLWNPPIFTETVLRFLAKH